jgi:hypothetical protein
MALLRDYIEEKYDAVSFMAFSGNGFHLHFPLPHTPLTGKAFRREVNKKIKKLAEQMASKAGDVEIDHVCDLRRVTTIISSYNLKIPEKPQLTRWNRNDIGKRVEDAREKNYKIVEAIFGTKVGTGENNEDESNDEPSAGYEDFEEILSVDEKLKDLYNGDWQKYGYKSRSEAEQAVLVALCEYGFDDDTITRIMENCKIGKWQERNDSYRSHSLKKAREFAFLHKKDDSSCLVTQRSREKRRLLKWGAN